MAYTASNNMCSRGGLSEGGGVAPALELFNSSLVPPFPGLQYVVLDWLMSDSRPSLCPLQTDECINYIL